MKVYRCLSVLMSICCAVLLTASLAGCEDSINQPASDVVEMGGPVYDGSGFGIMPGEAAITAAYSTSIQFEALNGRSPYTWRVSRSDLGSISSDGLYTSLAVEGENMVTVSDGAGNAVQAKVTQTTPSSLPLTITPASVSIAAGVPNMIDFVAAGGFRPYTWSVTDGRLGEISSSGRYRNQYDERGTNSVILRDAAGNVASAIVIQN